VAAIQLATPTEVKEVLQNLSQLAAHQCCQLLVSYEAESITFHSTTCIHIFLDTIPKHFLLSFMLLDIFHGTDSITASMLCCVP
jgi:hypothetical protein